MPTESSDELYLHHLPYYAMLQGVVEGASILQLGPDRRYEAEVLARFGARAVCWVGQGQPTQNTGPGADLALSECITRVDADFQALPFDDDQFELVFAFEALFRGSELEAALTEIKRVLAPDGILVVSAPNFQYDELQETAGLGLRRFQHRPPGELYEAVRSVFVHVNVLSQVPFLGYALIETPPAGPDPKSFDLSYDLLGGLSEATLFYTFFAGEMEIVLEEDLLVQVPFSHFLDRVQGGLRLLHRLLEQKNSACLELRGELDLLRAEAQDEGTGEAAEPGEGDSPSEADDRDPQFEPVEGDGPSEPENGLRSLEAVDLAPFFLPGPTELAPRLRSEIQELRGLLQGAEREAADMRRWREQVRERLAVLLERMSRTVDAGKGLGALSTALVEELAAVYEVVETPPLEGTAPESWRRGPGPRAGGSVGRRTGATALEYIEQAFVAAMTGTEAGFGEQSRALEEQARVLEEQSRVLEEQSRALEAQFALMRDGEERVKERLADVERCEEALGERERELEAREEAVEMCVREAARHEAALEEREARVRVRSAAQEAEPEVEDSSGCASVDPPDLAGVKTEPLEEDEARLSAGARAELEDEIEKRRKAEKELKARNNLLSRVQKTLELKIRQQQALGDEVARQRAEIDRMKGKIREAIDYIASLHRTVQERNARVKDLEAKLVESRE